MTLAVTQYVYHNVWVYHNSGSEGVDHDDRDGIRRAAPKIIISFSS